MRYLQTSAFLAWVVLLAGPAVYGQPALNADSLRKEAAKQKTANKKAAAGMQFRYFVIKAEAHTYGYDIYADGNLFIHQPTLPGMGGTKGFLDTASAGRTARLVIKKIQEGENPPTVTETELNKLTGNKQHRL